jgi:hypothetical protein
MESSTEFLDCEKEKLFAVGNENIEMLSKLKKFMEFLNQIENATNENILLQLQELADIKNMSDDMFEVFKIICQNLFEKNQTLKHT